MINLKISGFFLVVMPYLRHDEPSNVSVDASQLAYEKHRGKGFIVTDGYVCYIT